jgi:hypothetical protein
MPAELTVIYWRDIPAQVVAKAGRVTARRQLAPRFAEAIDRAAMLSGARDADSYLEQWRRGRPTPCGDDIDIEAQALAAEIESAYDDARLARLAGNGGHAPE